MSARNRRQFHWLVFPLVTFVPFSHAKSADTSAENAEIKQIYDADQKDRETPLDKALD